MKLKLLNKTETKIEIEIKDIAEELANATDSEQSEFFNLFFNYLRARCKNQYLIDNQLSWICIKLDSEALKNMRFIADYNLEQG